MRHPASPLMCVPLLASLVGCTGELVGAEDVDEAYIHGGTLDEKHLAVGRIGTDKYDNDRLSWCSGTLIAPDAVLTAGHCVGEGESTFSIQSGWFLFWPTFDWMDVTTKVTAPGYGFNSEGRIQHDLAVLRLAGAFEGVEPMRIAAGPPEVGAQVTIVGYGQSASGPQGSPTLDRRSALSWVDEVRPDVLVASDEGGTACWGDSGGPMLLESGGVESVVGVHSKMLLPPGQTESRCGDPFAEARPDLELDWIARAACTPDHGLGSLPAGCVPRLPDCACR